MRVEKLPFEKVQAFSKLFVNYCNDEPALASFYGEKPTIAGFGDILKRRQFSQESREVLVKTLQSQYETLEQHEAVEQNIALCKELCQNRQATVGPNRDYK